MKCERNYLPLLNGKCNSPVGWIPDISKVVPAGNPLFPNLGRKRALAPAPPARPRDAPLQCWFPVMAGHGGSNNHCGGASSPHWNFNEVGTLGSGVFCCEPSFGVLQQCDNQCLASQGTIVLIIGAKLSTGGDSFGYRYTRHHMNVATCASGHRTGNLITFRFYLELFFS